MSVFEIRTLKSVLRAEIYTVINFKLMQLRHAKYMLFSQIWMKMCGIKVSDIFGPQKVYNEGK